uniref:Uncharacterized protein n=1 Tax=Schistocephalus solidus TaxID=70667 RepID=A0A0X3P6Z6_SCHSO
MGVFPRPPVEGPLTDSDKKVLRSGAICCGIPALLLFLLGLILLILGVVFIVQGRNSGEFISKAETTGIPLTAFGVFIIVASFVLGARTICLLVILRNSTEDSTVLNTDPSKAAYPRQEYGTYTSNEPSAPPPYDVAAKQ